MKKILFCQPTLNYTGSEKSLLEILKGLHESKDIELYVLGGQEGNISTDYKNYIKELYLTNSSKLNKKSSSIMPFIRSFYTVYRDLKKINKIRNFDSIYVNTLMFPQATIASRLIGLKPIVHIRETEERYPKIVYNLYYLIALLLSRRIVVVSEKVLNQRFPFKKNFLKKSELIYNASSLTNSKIEKKLSTPYNLLAVIPVSEKKGIYELVYFCKDLKKLLESNSNNFILNVVGNISNKELYLEIKELLTTLSLSENVIFHGEQRNMGKFYAKADVLIHPSPNESFGRVLIEAMNYSTPTISFNNGGASEIIVDHETGYIVDNKNYSLMAEKTFKLLSSPNLYEKFSKRSFEVYNEKFSLKKLTKDIKGLLASNW